MTTTHNLGFPRIGARRELKFTLERFWKSEAPAHELQAQAAQLRQRHWQQQSRLDLAPVGDFSLYDQVLDMSFTLGNVPARAHGHGDRLDAYFRVARGRSAGDSDCGCVHAGEMTKWFDTNYHYIVPEFDAATRFALDTARLDEQLAQARALGVKAKPVIVGPLTYLWLGKAKDGSARLDLLPQLVTVYAELLAWFAAQGIWCTARLNATTWSNTSANSSTAMPSANTAGYSRTARAASSRRSCSATCAARRR